MDGYDSEDFESDAEAEEVQEDREVRIIDQAKSGKAREVRDDGRSVLVVDTASLARARRASVAMSAVEDDVKASRDDELDAKLCKGKNSANHSMNNSNSVNYGNNPSNKGSNRQDTSGNGMNGISPGPAISNRSEEDTTEDEYEPDFDEPQVGDARESESESEGSSKADKDEYYGDFDFEDGEDEEEIGNDKVEGKDGVSSKARSSSATASGSESGSDTDSSSPLADVKVDTEDDTEDESEGEDKDDFVVPKPRQMLPVIQKIRSQGPAMMHSSSEGSYQSNKPRRSMEFPSASSLEYMRVRTPPGIRSKAKQNPQASVKPMSKKPGTFIKKNSVIAKNSPKHFLRRNKNLRDASELQLPQEQPKRDRPRMRVVRRKNPPPTQPSNRSSRATTTDNALPSIKLSLQEARESGNRLYKQATSAAKAAAETAAQERRRASKDLNNTHRLKILLPYFYILRSIFCYCFIQ